MLTIWIFDGTENEHDVYRGIYQKIFVNHKQSVQWKEENDTINKQTAGIVWKEKICYICKKKKKFELKYTNDNDFKVKDLCHYTGKYRGAADSMLFKI